MKTWDQFLQLKEANNFFGLIDPKSVEDKEVYKKYIKGTTTHTYEDKEKCVADKIKSPNISYRLKKHIKKGYFAILWNDDKALIIFRNNVFELPIPWNQKQLSKVVEYGKNQDIDQKYWNELLLVMRQIEN